MTAQPVGIGGSVRTRSSLRQACRSCEIAACRGPAPSASAGKPVKLLGGGRSSRASWLNMCSGYADRMFRSIGLGRYLPNCGFLGNFDREKVAHLVVVGLGNAEDPGKRLPGAGSQARRPHGSGPVDVQGTGAGVQGTGVGVQGTRVGAVAASKQRRYLSVRSAVSIHENAAPRTSGNWVAIRLSSGSTP